MNASCEFGSWDSFLIAFIASLNKGWLTMLPPSSVSKSFERISEQSCLDRLFGHINDDEPSLASVVEAFR